MTMKQEIADINRQARAIRNIRLELQRDLSLLDTGAFCGRTFEVAEAKPGAPKVGQTTVVERWDGSRWIEVKMTWNGQAFVEAK